MQVYLNGAWTDEHQARISPFDRGFLFGDGVYEVLPVYRGQVFRLDAHLARLRASLQAIALPAQACDWAALCQELVARNAIGDGAIYLQVTRPGEAGKREHGLPPSATASVFAFAYAYRAEPDPESGISAVCVPDIRWARNAIKATSLLANSMTRQQAADAGAQEALLIRDGKLLEGSSSNVWLVRDGRVATPPEQGCMLTGITRLAVIDACREAGVDVVERDIRVAELADADELWISSSLRELRAVTVVDGRVVGDGSGLAEARTGPIYRRVLAALQAIKTRECPPR